MLTAATQVQAVIDSALRSQQDGLPANDLDRALQELDGAVEKYDRAANYYEGALPEVFATPRLRQALMRSGLSLQFNFAHNVVDAVADRLDISTVTINGDTKNSVVAQLWKDNALDLQAYNIMTKALTFGDLYVIVWPDDQDETKVKIRLQDPRTVRILYKDNDPLEPWYAIKRWKIGVVWYVDLYYPDRIEHYESTPKSKGTDWRQFSPSTIADVDGDNDAPVHEPVEDNPYGELPVFHFRTDADCYGEPIHRQFYSTQDSIHETMLYFLVNLAYAGFPQRYRLLSDTTDSSDAAVVDEGNFDIALSDTGGTQPFTGEAKSTLKADPGSMWELANTKSIGQLAAAPSENFIHAMSALLKYGAFITNTPVDVLDPTAQQLSGAALTKKDLRFAKKVMRIQRIFGHTWTSLLSFGLRLMGFDDAEVDVKWVDSTISNDMDTWQLIQLKQNNGVPTERTLVESGYDVNLVAEWMASGQYLLTQRLDALGKLGTALSGFARATQAGVVNVEQVQATVDLILADFAKPADSEGINNDADAS